MIIQPSPIRSQQANRLYWAAIVSPFAAFLQRHDPTVTKDDAHDALKRRFLREPILDQETGELLDERIGSTADLTVEQFTEYVHRCARHLREHFGIEISLNEAPNER